MRYNKLLFTILIIVVFSLVYILKYGYNDAISFESYVGNTEIDYGTVESIQVERAILDSTIWKNEVLAQRYEESVIALWDSIRIREDKFSHINKFSFENIFIPGFTNEKTIDMGIKKGIYSDQKNKLTFKEWTKIVDGWKDKIDISHVEFHQKEFHPGDKDISLYGFEFHFQYNDA